MSPSRASAAAAGGVVGVVVVALLVLTALASVVGPGQVLRSVEDSESSDSSTSSTESTTQPSPSPTPPAESDGESEPEDNGLWGERLFVSLLGVFALVLLYAVSRQLLKISRKRLGLRVRRRVRAPQPDFEIVDAPSGEQAARAVAAVEEEQREALETGEPRNAIVECWHLFETSARSLGIARHPWETASEFTLRVLDEASSDAEATHELAGLYREARFSEHEIGETQRGQARSALDALHGSLTGRR